MVRIVEAGASKTENSKKPSGNFRDSNPLKSRFASLCCLSAVLGMTFLYFQSDNLITHKLLISGIIIFGLLFLKNQQN